MSFITKRERVFNEYDLFDLPARNEGKLKAYASCTDARAWSHFCSDKTEHLVEIIKRNNETCRPKYVPTDVIVNTLMVAKNTEIARLKHRIQEFEQMLAVYDQLELTCDQKCEIANAHAAIKAANKELDELCFDLDLSSFTEGIDSEVFETGKSRGDEPSRYKLHETPRSKEMEWSFDKDPPPKMETKSAQIELSCHCDASTLATDPRIDEMQDTIIAKDAKLNAMQNTIAVMENDVCEPYCIYAHIYTALEKIFAILCQNDKYKQYLRLLIAGKDIRCVDLKGKILFKLKVLEKFSLALIAPCSQDFNTHNQDCSCCRAEIVTYIDTTFALTTTEYKKPCIDNKRAQLVADIMENEEMKEILSKQSCQSFEDALKDDVLEVGDYVIDRENLKRLKNLQDNFDDLMSCYESLKFEKECLQVRCRKYEELEKELETIRSQLIEYNTLWNEKEHYRKRSNDLDSLKEKYFVLTEEVSNLEIQLKAEAEINAIKSSTIEELRFENVMFEKKLNETAITFEKDKNAMQCKLKESECKIMCQEQQIGSLSLQIDRLLEQTPNNDSFNDRERETFELYNEIESLKEQLQNLKEALFCSDEDKQLLQNDYENNLHMINELKMEIEEWKSKNEKMVLRNEHLEKGIESVQDKVHRLIKENKTLSLDVEDKTTAVENLMHVLNGKSQEVQRLMEELNRINSEKCDLSNKLHELQETYNTRVTSLEKENDHVLKSLELAKQESRELLEKVKNYDDLAHKQKDLTKTLEMKSIEYSELKKNLLNTTEENKNLQADLAGCKNDNAILMQEVQRLREINNYAVTNINSLKDEKNHYQQSLELNRKESEILEDKVRDFENLSEQLSKLQISYDNLLEEKRRLEHILEVKNMELESAVNSILLTRKTSEELLSKLHESEETKHELKVLSEAFLKIAEEKQDVQNNLAKRNEELEDLVLAVNKLKSENYILLQKLENHSALETELAQMTILCGDLESEKKMIHTNCSNMTDKIKHLNSMLESQIEETKELKLQMKVLEEKHVQVINDIGLVENEKNLVLSTLETVTREKVELLSRLNHLDSLSNEFSKLKRDYDQIKKEKDRLQTDLNGKISDLLRMENENQELRIQRQSLLTHSEDLEQALINAKTELMTKPELIKESYSDLIKQIADIRQEKENNQTKIRHLMDNLEKAEDVISNLSEDLIVRNGKIAILENHINELEEEIRKLHITLENVMHTGEKIQSNYYEQVDRSLEKMEAHHSKAAHNMKIELLKLQNENNLLQEEISTTKIVTEKFSKDKNEFWSQVVYLQNERENIITHIKQLEIKAVGDSLLPLNNCSIEEVLSSIDRIQKMLESHNNKSVSLEKTLLRVQDSSQLLLSKADEAKKIVEQKKQKIISEKEDAIKEKLNLEKQLIDLKEKLEKQTLKDQNVIDDLKAETLNQKLIIDKLNSSRQSYISKLEEEMQSLKDVCQNSMDKIAELEKQIKNKTSEKDDLMSIVKRTNYELEEKSNEILILRAELAQLKHKTYNNIEIQVTLSDVKINMASQTDKESHTSHHNNINGANMAFDDKSENEIRNAIPDKKYLDFFSTPQSISNVQVLSANIEPSLDYVRNSYKKYKLQQLSPGHVEYYSISCPDENIKIFENPKSSDLSDSLLNEYADIVEQKTDNIEIFSSSKNLVDIYNKHSMHINSSKFIENETFDNLVSNNVVLKSNNFQILSKTELNNMVSFSNGSSTHLSIDKDLFFIYKDSESNHTRIYEEKESWSRNSQSDIVMKELETGSPSQNNINKKQVLENRRIYAESNMSIKGTDTKEELEFKPTLIINLPRVETQSTSIVSTSDGNKKSLISLSSIICSPTKHISISFTNLNAVLNLNQDHRVLSTLPYISKADNNVNISLIKPDNVSSQTNKGTSEKSKQKRKSDIIHEKTRKSRNHLRNRKNHSPPRHQLSRVVADVLHIKPEKDLRKEKSRANKEKNLIPGRFGLDYILDTIEREIDPNKIRKIHSDELFDQISIKEKSNSSPTRLSPYKLSSMNNKTPSDVNVKELNNKNQSKFYVDKGIMVRIDTSEVYEKKVQNLTKTLESIEKDYKKKIKAIKTQYDNNIKCIINEHNQGVNNIQSLHEETLQDILKIHENEVENLRTMGIEAMRKVDKLEKENRNLKSSIRDGNLSLLETEPVRMSSPELRKRKKLRDSKTLTKTNVVAFNVKPKSRSLGPCTCSLDVNISDTIRNIFEQVDVEQRKMAEHTYLKYIANKLLTSSVEALDAQELSFLHLKICRKWKTKLSKEEALQKKIDSMEYELMHKQRNAQKHKLDRKVAKERRRLQEVRETICRNSPPVSRSVSPGPLKLTVSPCPTANIEFFCDSAAAGTRNVSERRSAGDVAQASVTKLRSKCGTHTESNRAVLADLDSEERREKKLHPDELPTRLRKSHDRATRSHKK